MKAAVSNSEARDIALEFGRRGVTDVTSLKRIADVLSNPVGRSALAANQRDSIMLLRKYLFSIYEDRTVLQIAEMAGAWEDLKRKHPHKYVSDTLYAAYVDNYPVVMSVREAEVLQSLLVMIDPNFSLTTPMILDELRLYILRLVTEGGRSGLIAYIDEKGDLRYRHAPSKS